MATYNTPFRKSYAPAPAMNLSIGGRDRLGVAGGGPRFRDNWQPFTTPEIAGNYNEFGGYGGAEYDPRSVGLDPRYQQMDPRDRGRAAQQMRAYELTTQAQATATQQSLDQLREMARQQSGMGMPQAARGGRFSGPVRVHGGEIAMPAPGGGVDVLDPYASAEVERLMAESNGRDAAALAAANAPYERQQRGIRGFQSVAGRAPLSASADPGQMNEILSGHMHPDDASPEVRQTFMERMATDARFAHGVRQQWRDREASRYGVPIEVQRAAAAQFAQDQLAREEAMTPDQRTARDTRRDERDRQIAAQNTLGYARQEAGSAMRRQALVSDEPLQNIKGDDSQYTIDDVLFERTRNRRQGADIGVDPTTAGRQRVAISEGYRAQRENEKIGMVGAMNRGGNSRGDAAITSQAIRSLTQQLLSETTPADQKPAIQARLDALMSGMGGMDMGFPTSDIGPSGQPGAAASVKADGISGWSTASPQAKQAIDEILRPQVGDDGTIRMSGEDDVKFIANIKGNTYSNQTPTQLQSIYQSFDRITDMVEQAGGVADKSARRLVLEQINQMFGLHGLDSTDLVVRPLNTGSDPNVPPILNAKKAMAELVTEMLNGGRPPKARFDHLKRMVREAEKPRVPTDDDRRANINRFLRTGQTP